MITPGGDWTGGEPGPDDLYFLPLGGTGEIGMNLNLYGHDGAWLMVDLGVTFTGQTIPGVELAMADPALATNSERLGELSGELAQTEEALRTAISEWERLAARLEAFRDIS